MPIAKDVYGMGLVSNLLKAGKDSVTDYVRTQKNYYIDGTNVMRLYELKTGCRACCTAESIKRRHKESA